jgi:hypothetical protein
MSDKKDFFGDVWSADPEQGPKQGSQRKTGVPPALGFELGEGVSFGVSQTDDKLYIGEPEALARAGVPMDQPFEVRRWEIFVPVFYLDSGEPVQPNVFSDIRKELEREFGGVFSIEGAVHLTWTLKEDDDFVYNFDEAMKKFSVCARNTPENLSFFRGYKIHLQKLLKNQNGVVIESYLVETV